MIDLIPLVLPALCAGMMIVLVHSVLGIEVLKRGIVFMDIAIAQLAGFGFVLSQSYLGDNYEFSHQLVALSFALLGAVIFRWFEREVPQYVEALIGVSFVFTASLSLLVLADNPHGGEEIQHLLSGHILFVTWQDVLMHAPVYLCIFVLWFLKNNFRSGLMFYTLFALAVTSSVQLVGVYVVFISLILPAVVLGLTHNNKYRYAWAYGVISLFVGIMTSIVCDLPSGSVIVASYVVLAALWVSINKLMKRV
ncbi:MAG: zinc/manganese transport system permease protein [Alphaproteobacteria bacterium]|jgi:zinc/manganese transport system permease protein